MAKVMRRMGAGMAALALAAACAVPAGAALASEESGSGGRSSAATSAGQDEETSGVKRFLGALGDLWDSTVSGGQGDASRSSIGDYVDYAFGAAAGAWDGLAAQWPEMRDALSSAAQDASAALAKIPDEIRGALEQTKSDTDTFLAQVASMQVSDAQTGKVLASVSDRQQMGDVMKALDFARWTSTDAVPAADTAQTRVAFMLSKSALGFGDGLTDGAARSSSARDAKSASDVEQLAFTTYRDSQVVSVSILGSSGPLAQFQVPQADVDLLNGLAK